MQLTGIRVSKYELVTPDRTLWIKGDQIKRIECLDFDGSVVIKLEDGMEYYTTKEEIAFLAPVLSK